MGLTDADRALFTRVDVLRDLDAVCDTIIAYVRDQSLEPWR